LRRRKKGRGFKLKAHILPLIFPVCSLENRARPSVAADDPYWVGQGCVAEEGEIFFRHAPAKTSEAQGRGVIAAPVIVFKPTSAA
jgi:hypothetical protein